MLTIKTPERTYFTHCSSVSIVNFEHVIADWVEIYYELFLVFSSIFVTIVLSQHLSILLYFFN